MISLAQKLLAIYPDLRLLEDVILVDDGNGPYISVWNDLRPQPTDEELQAVELTAAKTLKIRELATARWEAECAGCEWEGPDKMYLVDSDPLSYGKFAGAVIAAQMGLWDGEWKCRNGRTPSLTPEQLISLASTVFGYVRGCYSWETVLTERVNLATTVADVEAINWNMSS